MTMEIRTYLDLMHTLEKLKCTPRHSWTSSGRREGVAEHSWRLALMAYFVQAEFPEADAGRVILMCLCHDLGEVFTGDVPAFQKTTADRTAEDTAIEAWLGGLPSPYRAELTALFAEMAAQETLEAKLYKALDKMEALIQHNEADIATWIPLEYELNFTYGSEAVMFSEYLTRLRAEINRDCAEKIEAEKAGNP